MREHIENHLLSQPTRTQFFLDNNRRDYYSVSSNIEIKQIVGRGLLFLGNKTYLYEGNNNAIWSSNQELHFGKKKEEVSSNEAFPYILNTDKYSKRISTKSYIGGTIPLFSEQILRGEIRYNWNENQRRIVQTPKDSEREQVQHQVLSGYLGLMKNQGVFIYNLTVDVGWQHLNYRSHKNKKSQHPFFISPSIEVGWCQSNLHRLLLTSSYDTEAYNIGYINQIEYQESYRGMRKATQASSFFYKKWDNHLEYNYSDPRNKLFINSNVVYDIGYNRPMSALTIDGIRYTLYITDGGRDEKFTANTDFTISLKGLPLDLTTKLTYGQASSNFIINHEKETLDSKNISATLSAQSRFRTSPINGLLSFSLSKINQAYLQKQLHDQQHLASINSTLFGHFRGFSFQLSANHQWLKAQEKHWTFLLLSSSLRFTEKKWTVELVGKDLIHLTDNKWIVRDATLEYLSTTQYLQMPGHLMLSLRYTL